jgi:hypothetical protein
MKNKHHKQNKQNGFITLFFILGISFTFLTWISLSSERVFEYIYIKEDFLKNRGIIHNHILCADSFIDNLIGSRYNLSFINNFYEFNRNLYFTDNHKCQIKSISIINNSDDTRLIFFISGDFSFEYILKNGFVNFSKSFILF